MSKARSPRDVCSTTMGIRGLISFSSLRTWGPEFRCLGRLLLLRRPDRLARLVQIRGDRLHLGGDAVEGALEAKVLADPVGAAVGEEALDVGVVLAAFMQLLADLVVGHLDRELVGDRLEDELPGDRQRRLGAEPLLELLRRLAGELQVGAGVDAARLQAPGEARQQLTGARLDERTGR